MFFQRFNVLVVKKHDKTYKGLHRPFICFHPGQIKSISAHTNVASLVFTYKKALMLMCF